MTTTLFPSYPAEAYPGATYPGYAGTTTEYPILAPLPRPALTSHRVTSFLYELLDKHGKLIGPLDGVRPGGTLEWSAARSVKGSGQGITVVDTGQSIDWLGSRIRISRTITDATGTYTDPLGVWIPDYPTEKWTDTGRTWDVSLLDTTTLLDQRKIGATHTLAKGASVLTDARAYTLVATGAYGPWLDTARESIAITPSTKVAATDMTWPAGTTFLQIVNDELASINYWSLFADMAGVWHLDPYVDPTARELAWQFDDGANCIYTPAWDRTQNWGSVPTEVDLYTLGDSVTAPLQGVFQAPASWAGSEFQRGYAVTYTEQVNAADQATIDALAQRRYLSLASPQASVQIQHLPIPLLVNQAVRFRSTRAGIDGLFVVSNTRVPLAATGLQQTMLTEVLGG